MRHQVLRLLPILTVQVHEPAFNFRTTIQLRLSFHNIVKAPRVYKLRAWAVCHVAQIVWADMVEEAACGVSGFFEAVGLVDGVKQEGEGWGAKFGDEGEVSRFDRTDSNGDWQ